MLDMSHVGQTMMFFHLKILQKYNSKGKDIFRVLFQTSSVYLLIIKLFCLRFESNHLIAKFSANFSNCRIMLCAKSQWPPIWMVPLAITLLNGPLSSLGLRLTGEFEPSKNFFLFLAKFGFQMTDSRNKDESQGYIYGNITYQLPEENATTSNVSINSKTKFCQDWIFTYYVYIYLFVQSSFGMFVRF